MSMLARIFAAIALATQLFAVVFAQATTNATCIQDTWVRLLELEALKLILSITDISWPLRPITTRVRVLAWLRLTWEGPAITDVSNIGLSLTLWIK